MAREYMTAVRIKSALDEASQAEGGDVVRSLELSAYFTHCNLQPSHQMLALKTAMANAFKAKVRLAISQRVGWLLLSFILFKLWHFSPNPSRTLYPTHNRTTSTRHLLRADCSSSPTCALSATPTRAARRKRWCKSLRRKAEMKWPSTTTRGIPSVSAAPRSNLSTRAPLPSSARSARRHTSPMHGGGCVRLADSPTLASKQLVW